jgi:hypothetical protein
MGWGYRKRLNYGPIRINLSRSGVGASLGVRGFRITRSSTGRRYITLSLPGTGLSWQKTMNGSRRRARRLSVAPASLPSSIPCAQPLSGPPSLPASTGTSASPVVSGAQWWQQVGIRNGP